MARGVIPSLLFLKKGEMKKMNKSETISLAQEIELELYKIGTTLTIQEKIAIRHALHMHEVE